MVATPQASQTKPAEQRLLMHNIDWQTYQTLSATLAERTSTRLTYYHGTLELVAPLEAHENSSSLIGQFVEILTEELDLNLKSMASTTLDREDLSVGAEPENVTTLLTNPQFEAKS